jgi:RimJ/RimL family protein N-acetyltransferase
MDINYNLLKGTYLFLEPLERSHLPRLRELARDPRIWEYTKTLLVNDQYDEQFDQYIEAALDPRFTGAQASFVMREAGSGEVMGMTRYYRIEPFHRRLSIGYTWYAPNWWGRVHNKECKYLLLKYAFDTLGFQRVEFEVAHQNLRSQKAVEKIGGVREALLRKHGRHADGTLRHTVVFSIVDDEWPGIKGHLEAMVAQGAEK